ncbi:MAG: lamin tail domain-containing protein [Bythopirellula sp.]|nr:lamin tail domain-containing protein [Bythopirellula sp.]
MATSTAAFAQIEVLEVMYNATDDTAWEWIEVRNTGGSAINLNGYLGFNLGDADITDPNPTIDSGVDPDTTINPGEIAIIYDGFYGTANPNNFVDQKFRDGWGLGAGIKVIGAQFFPALTNTVGAQGQSIGFWASDAAWKTDQTPIEDDPINNPGVFTNRTTSFANAAFSLDYSGATFPSVDGVSSITWTGNGSNQVGTNWVQSVSGSNGAVTSSLVTFPGSVNSANDVGNPGIAPPGTPATTGLHITEIMYDPASSETDPRWEWVEIYNSTGAAIDLAGYVLDDFNATAHASANIAAGSVPAGGTAVLYNSILTGADFAAAWGATLNLVPVTNWTVAVMSLNNSPSGTAPFRQESVALWSSFASYTGDNVTQANAVAKLEYNEGTGFPTLSNGPSITLADLSFDPNDGASWDNAINGDAIGSFNATALSGILTLHPGGDVGSPGSFTVVVGGTPGDFDGDSDVDGRDFLVWQRGGSPVPFSAADLATWQGAYNGGLLSAVSVPEPTSLAMLALALVPMVCGRKR